MENCASLILNLCVEHTYRRRKMKKYSFRKADLAIKESWPRAYRPQLTVIVYTSVRYLYIILLPNRFVLTYAIDTVRYKS